MNGDGAVAKCLMPIPVKEERSSSVDCPTRNPAVEPFIRPDHPLEYGADHHVDCSMPSSATRPTTRTDPAHPVPNLGPAGAASCSRTSRFVIGAVPMAARPLRLVPDQPDDDTPDFDMPRDDDAERAVLGAVILGGPEILEEIRELVEPDDFYRPAHETIFRALCELADSGRPRDALA